LLLAHLLVGGVGVIAVERDGGGVVVQLVEPHAELRDGVCRDRQGEGTTVVLEEAVEAPSDAIVIERGDLPLGEPDFVGVVSSGPLADAVEGLAGQEEVLEQDQEPFGRIDAAASVLRGQIGAEGLLESQPSEDAIDDRQQADAVGVEIVAGGFGVMADLGGWLGSFRRLH